MIRQLTDRGFLLAQLPIIEQALTELRDQPIAGGDGEADDDRRAWVEGGEVGLGIEGEVDRQSINLALDQMAEVRTVLAEPDPAPPVDDADDDEDDRRAFDFETDRLPFLPDDPVLSLLQSALETYFETQQPDAVEEVAATDDRRGAAGDDLRPYDRVLVGVEDVAADLGGDDRRLFTAFEYTDPRWIASAIAHGLRKWTGKHPFVEEPAPPVRMAERTRLVLVGDWGSGISRARAIADRMRTSMDEALDEGADVHVVHLGDVYYSGYPREYDNRFLGPWPVCPEEADAIGSWCLNANHDMYSGGYGYFDHLLADPRFSRHNGSSWFTLENDHWCFVGLDTAWDEVGLHDPRTTTGLVDPQADKVAELANRDDRPLVLLSHHPLFSAYEDVGPFLGQKLQPVLDQQRVKAWFWGHEHRAVAYDPFANVGFGRCVGNGGVPVYRQRRKNDRKGHPTIRWVEQGRVGGLFKRFAIFGYVTLDLDGATITATYFDEDGNASFHETIQ